MAHKEIDIVAGKDSVLVLLAKRFVSASDAFKRSIISKLDFSPAVACRESCKPQRARGVGCNIATWQCAIRAVSNNQAGSQCLRLLPSSPALLSTGALYFYRQCPGQAGSQPVSSIDKYHSLLSTRPASPAHKHLTYIGQPLASIGQAPHFCCPGPSPPLLLQCWE